MIFAIAVAIGTIPAPSARANDDLVKGLAILGVGGIILNEMNKNNRNNNARNAPAAPAAQRAPAQPSAARQAAMDLQSALNNFGFDAGPVDGRPGNKTRAAVASYQGTLGHPQTGEITAVERQLLLDSVVQERLNPAEAAQLAAANPFGRSGLPAAYRQKAQAAYGVPASPVPAAQPAAIPPIAAAAAPAPTAPDQLVIPGDFAIPTQPVRSVNGHCNNVSVLTTTNGGFATAAAMPDPALAMNEQFCLARTFAISEGQKVASSAGATQEQISTLCGQQKAWLLPQLSGLETSAPDTVVAAVRKAYSDAGKTADQMGVAGRICLSEAYRTDDASAANVSAVVLAASGQTPYAELIGHHLREGFGATATGAAGKAWMQYALASLAAGAAPVFLPGQSAERVAILDQALAAP